MESKDTGINDTDISSRDVGGSEKNPAIVTKTTATTTATIAPTIVVAKSSTPKQEKKSIVTSSTLLSGATKSAKIGSSSSSAINAATAAKNKSNSVGNVEEMANNEIRMLIENGYIKNKTEISGICGVLKENIALKGKISKLKSLLGRSAKLQRETKIEYETCYKKLNDSYRENEKLNKKINHLITRPTHMDLLADFESNFDRALLRVGQQQHQTGGQDTAGASPMNLMNVTGKDAISDTDTGTATSTVASVGGTNGAEINSKSSSNKNMVDMMLTQELQDSKARIEKLESLNKALLSRSSQLELGYEQTKKDYSEASNKLSYLELELRVITMEADAAKKQYEEKVASMQEMQMEIEMVTKASINAQKRAAHGEKAAKNNKNSSEHVHELESQISMFQEWALASAEAKQASFERVKELEEQVQKMQKKLRHQHLAATENNNNSLSNASEMIKFDNPELELEISKTLCFDFERILYSKSSTIVVGAGDVGAFAVDTKQECMNSMNIDPDTPYAMTMVEDMISKIALNEKLILKWKFDVQPNDQKILFSIVEGIHGGVFGRNLKALCKQREVLAGAAGETIIDVHNCKKENNSCTMLWSNKHSWIRPRTVTFYLELVVIDPAHHDY